MGTQSQPVSTSQLHFPLGKHLARQIFLETLAAIDVRHAMLSKLKWQGQVLQAGDVQLALPRPPRVVAFGKAAFRMAAVLAEILEGRVEGGVAVGPAEQVKKLPNFRYFVGGHPYPNAASFAAADAALELVSGLTPDDAVIFLVSGGGSALFEKPLDPAVTLEDFLEFNRVLVITDKDIEMMLENGRGLREGVIGRDAPGNLPSTSPTFPRTCPR